MATMRHIELQYAAVPVPIVASATASKNVARVTLNKVFDTLPLASAPGCWLQSEDVGCVASWHIGCATCMP